MKAYKQFISILLVLICVIQQAYSAASSPHTTVEESPVHEERDKINTTAADFLEKQIIDFLLTITRSPHLREQEINNFLGDLKILKTTYYEELDNSWILESILNDLIENLEDFDTILDTILATREGRLSDDAEYKTAETIHKIQNFLLSLEYKTADDATSERRLAEKMAEKEKLFGRLPSIDEMAEKAKLAFFERFPYKMAEKEKLDNLKRLAEKLSRRISGRIRSAEEQATIKLNTKELTADLKRLSELNLKNWEINRSILNLVSVIINNLKEHIAAEEKATAIFSVAFETTTKFKDILAEDRVVDLDERLKPCLRSILDLTEYNSL